MSKLLSSNSRQFHKLSLVDKLQSYPAMFSFTKAVDISLAEKDVDIADFSKTVLKKIILKSAINFQSKFCDIKSIKITKGQVTEIYVNFLGIAGIEGTLPECYIDDYIYGRSKKTHQAIADFFDIFNNRMLSLKYIFLKKHYVPCLSSVVEKSLIGKIVLSLAGFYKSPQEKMLLPEQLKIAAQHFLWRNVRSAESLRCILANFFSVPVEVKQFIGNFVEADKSLQTRLGTKEHRYNILGSESFLGNKVWSTMNGIDIFIGPLSYEKYISFLPMQSKYDDETSILQKACEIVRAFVPNEISVKINVLLDHCDVKETLLNGVRRLNRDSFLQGYCFNNPASFAIRV